MARGCAGACYYLRVGCQCTFFLLSICCLMGTLYTLQSIIRNTGRCVHEKLDHLSATLPVAKEYAGGQFKLSDMPVVPSEDWEKLGDKLKPLESSRRFKDDLKDDLKDYRFGTVSPEDAPELLFNGSSVEGVREQVPERFRGVYWLQGNAMPQVLAVLQYAKWHAETQTLLVPSAPWTWAWWDYVNGTAHLRENPILHLFRWLLGKQKRLTEVAVVEWISRYSRSGSAREEPEAAVRERSLKEMWLENAGRRAPHKFVADDYQVLLDRVQSFRFSACPAPNRYRCAANSTNLTYAEINTHLHGNLSVRGDVFYNGYTLEEYQHPLSAEPGERYFRRAAISCETGLPFNPFVDLAARYGSNMSFTGYNFTKILDKDGRRIEPHYTQYLKFSKGSQLVIWTGLPKKKAEKERELTI